MQDRRAEAEKAGRLRDLIGGRKNTECWVGQPTINFGAGQQGRGSPAHRGDQRAIQAGDPGGHFTQVLHLKELTE